MQPRAVKSLPVELWVLCAVAPVLYLPVLHRRIFEWQLGEIALAVAENVLPFLAIPLALEGLYRFVLPSRPLPAVRRVLLHVAVTTVVGLVVGALMQQLLIRLRDDGPPLFGFTLSCVVITWTLALPALLVQEYRERLAAQQRETFRAELEALQSRTHPHFLFNALNTVASLISRDPVLAESTVERLSEFLRYSLQSSRHERVALREEVQRVEDYLEVQRARFGARLRFSVSVEPALESFAVPPMVLLPLVENAVLHGVAPRVEGGTVAVRASRDGEGVRLAVEDGGGARESAASSPHRGSGTALDDLRRRLALLYGAGSSLVLSQNAGGGVTAEMRLPR